MTVQRLDQAPARAAARWGDRPALVDGTVVLSYRELEAKISALAERLRLAGVGPGSRCGVYAPRGVPAVLAVYAALRAGAVVGPLDVSDPPARTARIAHGCGLDVLIVTGGTEPAARRVGGATDVESTPLGDGLLLRLLRSGAGGVPADRPGSGGGYIFSTSGSTGWPKGVLLSHANVLHFARWAVRELGLTATDRVGAQSALTFDLSTFDIFASALAGAAVHVVPDGLTTFPRDLAAWLREGRITAFYAVPTLCRLLTSRGLAPGEGLPDLRVLAMAGEAIPPDLLARCLRQFPGTTFYNLYGPTETNVCTYERISPAWTPADGISIGRPIDATHVALLDDSGRPAEEGELFVAGPTVLTGYLEGGALRDPTREVRFPDGRVRRAYGTGDRARRGRDGRLTLLGRLDDQVKRRGHRIDLRDIESTLDERCRPDACAVVAKEAPYQGQIWAYVVKPAADHSSVTAALAEVLPRRMLPDRVVLVDRLPTGPHGKVDRRRLAARPDEKETHELSS